MKSKPSSRQRKRGPAVSFAGEKGWRFVRLWHTLMIIVESGEPLTVAEINARFARHPEALEYVGKIATTRTDLWVLVRSGFPLRATLDGGVEVDLEEYLSCDQSRRGRMRNVRWSLSDGSQVGLLESARQRRPTAAELSSLSLLRATLKDVVPQGFPLFEQVLLMLDALIAWLASHGRTSALGGNGKAIVGEARRRRVRDLPSGAMRTIADGLQRGVVVEGSYLCANGGDRFVQFQPQSIWFHEGRVHMLAARVPDGLLRVYRLDKFRELGLANGVQAPQVDREKVERLLNSRFGGFAAEPEIVHIRATSTIAYLFEEYSFHPSQKIRRMRDGSLHVSLHCAVSHSLEEWLLGLGEHAEVLAPAGLRDRIIMRLACALSKYRPQ